MKNRVKGSSLRGTYAMLGALLLTGYIFRPSEKFVGTYEGATQVKYEGHKVIFRDGTNRLEVMNSDASFDPIKAQIGKVYSVECKMGFLGKYATKVNPLESKL